MHNDIPYSHSINKRADIAPAKDERNQEMAKIEKTTDILETAAAAFDTSKTVDQFRAFAEKGVEQSKEAYAKLKVGAEEAQKTIESTFETVKTVSGDVSKKAIAAMRANAEAGFDHLESLIAAKSLSEIVELQTAFLRKNVEMAVDQAKDMQAVATKAADEVSKPFKGAFDKAMKELKVA